MQAWANTTAPSASIVSLNTTPLTPRTSPRKLVAPLLDRAQTHVLGVEAEKIEGDEAGLRAARLGAQRPEVAPSVGTEHDRLAVDQRAVGGQIADRLRDPWQSVREIRAISGP